MNRLASIIICPLLLFAFLLGCGGSGGGSTSVFLISITVSPADPSINIGTTRQFTAMGTYSDDSTQDLTLSATWASSDIEIAVIDSAGLATAVAAGLTTITAASGNIAGSTTLTVRDLILESPFGFHPAGVAKPGYTGNGYGDAQNIGVKWARDGIYAFWFLIQPDLSSQEYDFTLYDSQWSRIPNEMKVLANISPLGPINDSYCLPNSYLPVDEQKYVAFVKATVERYDGDGITDMPGLTNPIKHWMVWNEPNTAKSGFADLQRITYTAIKAACPDCLVLIGGVPGMPPVADYLLNFDLHYKPILDALGGKYVDIMDFHWYGNSTGDYRDAKEVYNQIRAVLNADGFPPIPIWITEMGSYSGDPAPVGPLPDYPLQTERQQALDYFKRFVYPLSFGVKKIFPAYGLMEGLHYGGGYFDYTGLIYDGWDPAGGAPYDLGLGVKKLGYYTYKKMTEMLEGSDWENIETIRDSGDVYIFKFIKQGAPVYVAWWDYFNDPSYTPGKTMQVSLSGLQGTAAVITEAVPKFSAGVEVTDYSTAFSTSMLTISNGSVMVDLGDSPVIVESPLLIPLKTIALTTDAEGGSARPEIVATAEKIYVVYLGNISDGNNRRFHMKIYDNQLETLIAQKTLFKTTEEYGGPTDIRAASDGQNLYAFFETHKTISPDAAETYLWATTCALNDDCTSFAANATLIAASIPMTDSPDGQELLDDPAPLIGPNSVFVVTRFDNSISPEGETVYHVREFDKDTLTLRSERHLDLSDAADGRGRVASLLFRNNSIYMALATTFPPDQVVREETDDGALSDIILVRMNQDWSFDPQTDVRTISAEPDDRENYITGLEADGNYFYITYKQTVGIPNTVDGKHRAMIKIFDNDFNLLLGEQVKETLWGKDGGEIRPSLEVFGNRIYSGQSAGQGIGTGNAGIYVYETQ